VDNFERRNKLPCRRETPSPILKIILCYLDDSRSPAKRGEGASPFNFTISANIAEISAGLSILTNKAGQ